MHCVDENNPKDEGMSAAQKAGLIIASGNIPIKGTATSKWRYIVKNYLSLPVHKCGDCVYCQTYFFLLMRKCCRDERNEFDVTLAYKAGEIDERCGLSKTPQNYDKMELDKIDRILNGKSCEDGECAFNVQGYCGTGTSTQYKQRCYRRCSTFKADTTGIVRMRLAAGKRRCGLCRFWRTDSGFCKCWKRFNCIGTMSAWCGKRCMYFETIEGIY